MAWFVVGAIVAVGVMISKSGGGGGGGGNSGGSPAGEDDRAEVQNKLNIMQKERDAAAAKSAAETAALQKRIDQLAKQLAQPVAPTIVTVYTCTCGEQFKDAVLRDAHSGVCPLTRKSCPMCSETFPDHAQMQSHYEQQHLTEVCPHCHLNVNRVQWTTHRESHRCTEAGHAGAIPKEKCFYCLHPRISPVREGDVIVMGEIKTGKSTMVNFFCPNANRMIMTGESGEELGCGQCTIDEDYSFSLYDTPGHSAGNKASDLLKTTGAFWFAMVLYTVHGATGAKESDAQIVKALLSEPNSTVKKVVVLVTCIDELCARAGAESLDAALPVIAQKVLEVRAAMPVGNIVVLPASFRVFAPVSRQRQQFDEDLHSYFAKLRDDVKQEMVPPHKQVRNCVVCCASKANHANVPCGHLCLCAGCATPEWLAVNLNCPVCFVPMTRPPLRIEAVPQINAVPAAEVAGM